MLKLLLRLSARNAQRRRVRSLLTISMVAVGVALLLVSLAYLEGVLGTALAEAAGAAGHVRIVQPGYAKREQLLPLHENIPDVASVIGALQAHPDVVDVFPKIATAVTVTADEEIGDIFGLAIGADPAYFDAYLGVRDELVAGGWFTGAKEELLLGAQLAEKTGAGVGDEIVLLGMTQYGSMSPIKGRVVGIVGKLGALEKQILLPLDRLQWLADMAGGATEILVFGREYQQAQRLADRLTSPELRGYDIAAWNQRAPFNALSGMAGAVSGVIASIVVFLVALGIWNTMMMSVLERTHEIGVMRAMGLNPPGAVALFLVEGLAIGFIGSLVGIALGALPAWLLEIYGINLGEQTARQMSATVPVPATVHADLTPELMVWSFLLGLVMAVLGGTLPAIHAARIQPVAAMRSGR
ncbi:MAG: ABC transporter permease [Myxococcales bacterium]|nr:ABC transporter permease [Myxococcales bacterium]